MEILNAFKSLNNGNEALLIGADKGLDSGKDGLFSFAGQLDSLLDEDSSEERENIKDLIRNVFNYPITSQGIHEFKQNDVEISEKMSVAGINKINPYNEDFNHAEQAQTTTTTATTSELEPIIDLNSNVKTHQMETDIKNQLISEEQEVFEIKSKNLQAREIQSEQKTNQPQPQQLQQSEAINQPQHVQQLQQTEDINQPQPQQLQQPEESLQFVKPDQNKNINESGIKINNNQAEQSYTNIATAAAATTATATAEAVTTATATAAAATAATATATTATATTDTAATATTSEHEPLIDLNNNSKAHQMETDIENQLIPEEQEVFEIKSKNLQTREIQSEQKTNQPQQPQQQPQQIKQSEAINQPQHVQQLQQPEDINQPQPQQLQQPEESLQFVKPDQNKNINESGIKINNNQAEQSYTNTDTATTATAATAAAAIATTKTDTTATAAAVTATTATATAATDTAEAVTTTAATAEAVTAAAATAEAVTTATATAEAVTTATATAAAATAEAATAAAATTTTGENELLIDLNNNSKTHQMETDIENQLISEKQEVFEIKSKNLQTREIQSEQKTNQQQQPQQQPQQIKQSEAINQPQHVQQLQQSEDINQPQPQQLQQTEESLQFGKPDQNKNINESGIKINNNQAEQSYTNTDTATTATAAAAIATTKTDTTATAAAVTATTATTGEHEPLIDLNNNSKAHQMETDIENQLISEEQEVFENKSKNLQTREIQSEQKTNQPQPQQLQQSEAINQPQHVQQLQQSEDINRPQQLQQSEADNQPQHVQQLQQSEDINQPQPQQLQQSEESLQFVKPDQNKNIDESGIKINNNQAEQSYTNTATAAAATASTASTTTAEAATATTATTGENEPLIDLNNNSKAHQMETDIENQLISEEQEVFEIKSKNAKIENIVKRNENTEKEYKNEDSQTNWKIRKNISTLKTESVNDDFYFDIKEKSIGNLRAEMERMINGRKIKTSPYVDEVEKNQDYYSSNFGNYRNENANMQYVSEREILSFEVPVLSELSSMHSTLGGVSDINLFENLSLENKLLISNIAYESIKHTYEKGGENELTVRLRPDEFGNMLVSIRKQDNKLYAKITTDSLTMSSLLQFSISDIIKNLNEEGLEIAEVDISFSDKGGDMQEQEFREDSDNPNTRQNIRLESDNEIRFSQKKSRALLKTSGLNILA